MLRRCSWGLGDRRREKGCSLREWSAGVVYCWKYETDVKGVNISWIKSGRICWRGAACFEGV